MRFPGDMRPARRMLEEVLNIVCLVFQVCFAIICLELRRHLRQVHFEVHYLALRNECASLSASTSSSNTRSAFK
jgi:hypothetical protein